DHLPRAVGARARVPRAVGAGRVTTQGDLDALYPFLAAGAVERDDDSVLAEVRRSTAEKAAEIVALRDRLAVDLATDLTACAAAMAARFTAGGRLYCFGNGGSSTDAQAVAALFCAPGEDGPAGLPVRPLPAVALPNDVAVLT